MVLDQRDVHRELAVARQELARAIERIDEPVAAPLAAHREGDLRGLLRQHRQLGREPSQLLHDQPVRTQVGSGERRVICLGGRRQRLCTVHLEDPPSRRARNHGAALEQGAKLGTHALPITLSDSRCAMTRAAA